MRRSVNRPKEKGAADAAESTPGWMHPRSLTPECRHTTPSAFRAGQPLGIELALKDSRIRYVTLHCRHVNQAEPYAIAAMTGAGGRGRHPIPPGYADSVFPLLCYFVLRDGSGNAWLYPGFTPELSNQPYFAVRRAG